MKKLLLLTLPLGLSSCLPSPPPPMQAPALPQEPRPAPQMPSMPPPSSPASFRPEDLVGLTEEEAMSRTRGAGLGCRVVERDGVRFPVTMDYSESRLNLAVRSGRVVRVTRG